MFHDVSPNCHFLCKGFHLPCWLWFQDRNISTPQSVVSPQLSRRSSFYSTWSSSQSGDLGVPRFVETIQQTPPQTRFVSRPQIAVPRNGLYSRIGGLPPAPVPVTRPALTSPRPVGRRTGRLRGSSSSARRDETLNPRARSRSVSTERKTLSGSRRSEVSVFFFSFLFFYCSGVIW